MPHFLMSRFIRLPLVLRILSIALLVIFIFGWLVHIIEPYNFPKLADGIWWAIITASTVGYGDFVPETALGRFTGVVLIMTGAGFLASYFVALATAAVTRQNDFLEGKVAYKGADHIIVIGWNERSREILNTICSSKSNHYVTLIDETLEYNPLPHKNLHFIQGRANRDEVLLKTNIHSARKVIITADQNKNELHADMNSILTLLAVKGLNPKLPCIVEILTAEQSENARRAGADEIIQTNLLTSFVMINSITSQELVNSFLGLLNQLDKRKLTFQPASEEIINQSFQHLSQMFIVEGILLLGIKRGEETIVNPPHPFIVAGEDQLIVIMN